MSYDVFISYRRSTGADDARLLQQAFKARGFEVFFDYDSLRDGKKENAARRGMPFRRRGGRPRCSSVARTS